MHGISNHGCRTAEDTGNKLENEKYHIDDTSHQRDSINLLFSLFYFHDILNYCYIQMQRYKQLPIINFYEMDLIDEQRVAKQKALDAFSVTTNIKSLLKAEKNELNKIFAEYYLETLEAINKTIKL